MHPRICQLLFASSWGARFARHVCTGKCVLRDVFPYLAIGRIGFNRIVNVDMIPLIPAVRCVIFYLTNDNVAAVGACHPGNFPQDASVRSEKQGGGDYTAAGCRARSRAGRPCPPGKAAQGATGKTMIFACATTPHRTHGQERHVEQKLFP